MINSKQNKGEKTISIKYNLFPDLTHVPFCIVNGCSAVLTYITSRDKNVIIFQFVFNV